MDRLFTLNAGARLARRLATLVCLPLYFQGHALAQDTVLPTVQEPVYHSVFEGYQVMSEPKLTPWPAANDTVREVGGWRAYAKEAAAANAAAADTTAGPPATAAPHDAARDDSAIDETRRDAPPARRRRLHPTIRTRRAHAPQRTQAQAPPPKESRVDSRTLPRSRSQSRSPSRRRSPGTPRISARRSGASP